jgi:hypothetical protein
MVFSEYYNSFSKGQRQSILDAPNERSLDVLDALDPIIRAGIGCFIIICTVWIPGHKINK